MKFYSSSGFISGQPVSTLFKKEADWYILCEQDTRSLPTYNSRLNFIEITRDDLEDKLPGVFKHLNDSSYIVIDRDNVTGEIRINPLFNIIGEYDYSARADHQVNIKISIWKYLLSKKYYLPKMVLVVSVLIIISLLVTWAFLLIIAILFVRHVQQIQNDYNLHFMGELLPGIVISENPLRIASLANLSAFGDGNYKTVKIQRIYSLKKVYKKGQKIPLSGSYSKLRDESPYWNYWHFFALPEVISMNQSWAKVYEIPQYKWDELYKRIPQIENIIGEKYLPIISEDSSWNNSEEITFVYRDSRIEKVNLSE